MTTWKRRESNSYNYTGSYCTIAKCNSHYFIYNHLNKEKPTYFGSLTKIKLEWQEVVSPDSSCLWSFYSALQGCCLVTLHRNQYRWGIQQKHFKNPPKSSLCERWAAFEDPVKAISTVRIAVSAELFHSEVLQEKCCHFVGNTVVWLSDFIHITAAELLCHLIMKNCSLTPDTES